MENISDELPHKLIKFDNLHDGLRYLNCSRNKIIELNNLPIELEVLIANYNNLVKLDFLPEGLMILQCYNNLLTKLDDLPEFIGRTTLLFKSNRNYWMFIKKNKNSLLSI